MRNLPNIAGGALALWAALLLAGCGDREEAEANTAVDLNASEAAIVPGNDPSAMETVANAPAAVDPVIVRDDANRNSAGEVETDAATLEDADTPPGGDLGGNSSDRDIPGM